MSNNYDIILIGLVAVFLILRLRSVLGKRTGSERPPTANPFERPPPAPPGPAAGSPPGAASGSPIGGNDNVIALPTATPPVHPLPGAAGAIRASVLPAATAGVAAVRAADPTFDPAGFAGGARTAFATIVEAFARGDTKILRPLLDDRTYASFESAIGGREQTRQKVEATLIGFEASDIAAAEMQGSHAAVTLRFVSEQINVTRNAEGLVVDGNPNEVQKVVDLWTFRRDTKSSDPNWLLIKTESDG